MIGTPHTKRKKSFWVSLHRISAKSTQWLNIGSTGSTPGEINKCDRIIVTLLNRTNVFYISFLNRRTRPRLPDRQGLVRAMIHIFGFCMSYYITHFLSSSQRTLLHRSTLILLFLSENRTGKWGDKEKKTWTPFTRTILNIHSSSKLPSKHSLSGICNGARLYTHFSLESLRRGIVLVLAYHQFSSLQFSTRQSLFNPRPRRSRSWL